MASLAAGRDTRPASRALARAPSSLALLRCRIAGARLTGAGVGLAWIVYGLGERDDASVFTVDTNEELLVTVAAAGWPGYVQFVHDDGAHAVREFAPSIWCSRTRLGGKLEGLDGTIEALAAGGVLIVDDMDPARHAEDGLLAQLGAVRDQILGDPSLVAAELDFASGVIVATKRPV